MAESREFVPRSQALAKNMGQIGYHDLGDKPEWDTLALPVMGMFALTLQMTVVDKILLDLHRPAEGRAVA